MNLGEALGLAAGIFTTGAIIPQAVRVFRTKSARDVSLTFNLMLLTGTLLWLLYGILDKLVPIILWNVLGTVLISILLIGKLKYDAVSRRKPGRGP